MFRCTGKRCTSYSSTRTVAALQDSSGATEEMKDEILRALTSIQESIKESASDAVPEPNLEFFALPLAVLAALVAFNVITGVIDEAVELYEYDRDPRFLPELQQALEGQQAQQQILGRVDSHVSQLMLKSGDVEQNILPVKEQLILEQALKKTADEVASREAQITFLLVSWALLSEGTQAFFRTPNAPLQP